jgi:co-chaperonin GroES (HSP10)
MKLLHDYILINPIKEEQTQSGIIIPVDVQNKQLVGEIAAIGSDIEDENLHVKSKVLYDKLNSSDIEVEHIKYVICQYQDVIAIL